MKNSFATLSVSLLMSVFAITAHAAGDAAKGEALAAPCAACHGKDGNSASPMFPKLAGQGEKYLLKQLNDIQSGNRTVAEMAGQLDGKSAQDLADLAAYFASKTMQLSGAKAMKVHMNSGDDVDALSLAAKLYRSGDLDTNVPACSGCHSPTGQGNAPAGYPRLSGQWSDYVEKQLRAFRAGERTNDGDSRVMRSVAKLLSDSDIKALANYVSGLN